MFNRSFSRVPLPAVIAGIATALVVACSDSSKLPSAPSASASPSGIYATAPGSQELATRGAVGSTQRVVDLLDACDPETFNAALGPGTCVRNGGVRFENFLELLSRHHSVGAWHFTPPQATMGVGDVLMAVNHGGETHTFTEVEEFGGGIVPMLNERMGLTTVAPECKSLAPSDFIPAGGSSSETEEEEGVEKYQCCIHPWMRAEVHIGH
jgi:plastocyanin